jgi:hypothetical protein
VCGIEEAEDALMTGVGRWAPRDTGWFAADDLVLVTQAVGGPVSVLVSATRAGAERTVRYGCRCGSVVRARAEALAAAYDAFARVLAALAPAGCSARMTVEPAGDPAEAWDALPVWPGI